MSKGRKPENLTGMRFGNLTVLRSAPDRVYKCGTVEKRWICRCDCGNETEVSRGNLKSGRVKTCGCSRGKRWQERKIHGERIIEVNKEDYKRIQNIRKHILKRCNDSHDKSFPIYGGRGISVCKDWTESTLAFYMWAKNNGYKEKLTIDRIDVNGNYEPENCRWISIFDQQSNKRTNVYIECLGEKHTIAQWARITGLDEETIRRRNKKGLPAKKVLGIEVHS